MDVDVDFLLEEDKWNDFGFMTLYHLHLSMKRVPDHEGALYLGSIQIMRKGQNNTERYLVRRMFGERSFNSLPDDFCSISFSLDLFGSLAQFLSYDERMEFVRSLRLILGTDDEYYAQVKDDECFKKSLLRNASMDSYYLKQGRALILGEGINYNLREQSVTVRYADSDDPVELDFSPVKDEGMSYSPNGIISFIGRNASGKSTALYKLATLLYTSPSDRDRYLENIGTIEPGDIGVAQLMILSYTPFDNFRLPGEDVDGDLKLWSDRINKREGRFLFCGLRDVEAEAKAILDYREMHREEKAGLRVRNVILKKQEELAVEAYNAFCRIYRELGMNEEWRSFLTAMDLFQPDLFVIAKRLEYSFPDQDVWVDTFHELSTGHKFLFHAILHIIAYCMRNALVLFDEPENHLQAPLLSFLMSRIRKILAERNAVMLVATHSPVILQETLASNVRIVRRDGDRVSFAKPVCETFGENFGAISAEVFDLTSDKVDYFNTIDELYVALDCDRMDTPRMAVEAIKNAMGGISGQTIQYVVGKHFNGKL